MSEQNMLVGVYYVFAGLLTLFAVLVVAPAWSSKFDDYGLVVRLLLTMIGGILFIAGILLFRSAGKEMSDFGVRRGVRKTEED